MSIGALTKLKITIPQLTLAEPAQSGRYQSRTQDVPCSIPTEGNFFAESIFLFHSQALLPILPTLYNYRKLDSKSERSLCLIQKDILITTSDRKEYCSLKNDEPMNNHTHSFAVFVIMHWSGTTIISKG